MIGQRYDYSPKTILTIIFEPIFSILIDTLYFDATIGILQKESFPFEWVTTIFFCISYSFGAMSRSILAKKISIWIWYINLKIDLFTTMVKVNIKALTHTGS